jgi:hypothetical protein
MMNGPEKSRIAIVAMKPANKTARSATEPSVKEHAAAESVGRRAGAKGNASQHRTQSRNSVPHALDRIRQVASDRSAVADPRWEPDAESRTSGSVRGGAGQRASLPPLPFRSVAAFARASRRRFIRTVITSQGRLMSFCNGARLVTPLWSFHSPGSCFCTGSARGRHLMGNERIGRPIYGSVVALRRARNFALANDLPVRVDNADARIFQRRVDSCIMLHGRPSMMLGAGASPTPLIRHHQFGGRPLSPASREANAPPKAP